MTNVRDVQEMLGLRTRPVAIAFLQEPPSGLKPWSGEAVPAGCAFWREAQYGASFYTVASDHFGCAVGSYTHAIDLPEDRALDLDDTLRLMSDSGYLKAAEVPGIPRLDHSPAVVAYGPAGAAGFAPDVVLLAASPVQAMLIYEAALRAGLGSTLTNVMGRPSCAVLPLTVNDGMAAVSLGCAGNRTYTGLGDDELYVTIPGARWEDLLARLAEILAANERMTRYYREHEVATTAMSTQKPNA